MPQTPESIIDEEIIRVDAVAQRIEKRDSRHKITSNGTIAAAVMVLAAIFAVIVANTPAYETVHHFFETGLTLGIGDWSATITLEQFVNDFLMAIFFLLVGIELKYEMTVGQLRRPRQAALPMLAAVGGVAVPSIIYMALNLGEGGAPHGWAVPMATDIAFALGIMSLLGDRVAPATKVFFSTLAIADDILAIIVIAVFYGQTPSIPWLAASLGCVVVLAALHHCHVYSSRWYILVGLVLWVCMFNSGIHATLAGVVLALFLPARSDIQLDALRDWLSDKANLLDDAYDAESHVLGQHDFTVAAEGVEQVMHHVTPPLERVENAISVLVNFFVFAALCLRERPGVPRGRGPRGHHRRPGDPRRVPGRLPRQAHRHHRRDVRAGEDWLCQAAARCRLEADRGRGPHGWPGLHDVDTHRGPGLHRRERGAGRQVRHPRRLGRRGCGGQRCSSSLPPRSPRVPSSPWRSRAAATFSRTPWRCKNKGRPVSHWSWRGVFVCMQIGVPGLARRARAAAGPWMAFPSWLAGAGRDRGDGASCATDRAEALGPAVGGQRRVELVCETGALVDAAGQAGDNLEQVVVEVVRLGHDLGVEVVHKLDGGIERVDEALQLAKFV